MLKVLIRKQLTEVFKGYFYNPKTNKTRSKAGIIGWIIFFIVIMVGLLGGMFTALSLSLCGEMLKAGAGWLYFVIMSGIAILLGAFGSIFNTYSGLYLSKDNDLLLSMPIPVKYIIASRLINVYIMGAMYSAVAIVPAVIVYLIKAGVTARGIFCGILLTLIITVIVLILSCLLGWCVAQVSRKLSNKSFVKTLAALAFIGLYYFFYFRAQDLVNQLLANAAAYGEQLKGSAHFLYVFGRTGEGDLKAAAITTVVCLAALVVVWRILKSTFLSIAISAHAETAARAKMKDSKAHSPFVSLMLKEISKFTSSSNYMLNCGLGILFIPALGVLLLIKGPVMFETIASVFEGHADICAVIFCAMIFMLSSMIDIAEPSVSLEGKSIWIPQSLPVEPKLILRAKAAVQMIFSAVPVLFTVVCGLIILKVPPLVKLLVCLASLMFTVFCALFHSFLGVRMPILSWTNEIVPIKQSGGTAIAIFGIWIIVALFAAMYFLFGFDLGAAPFLGIWTAITAAASLLLLKWLDTKGAARFSDL